MDDKKPRKTKASGTPTRSPDEEDRAAINRDATPRVKQLAELFDQVRAQKGLTRGELSRRTGIHRTNVSNFLNKKEGVGTDRALRYMDALGLAIRDSTVGEPIAVGTIGIGAMLTLEVGALSFPCSARVLIGFGSYQPGDIVHLAECSAFEHGKWLLFDRGGVRMFAKAEDRPNIGRVLVTADGDAFLYEADRHKIIARIYGYFREE